MTARGAMTEMLVAKIAGLLVLSTLVQAQSKSTNLIATVGGVPWDTAI